jgi:hypothetical protein
MVNGEEHRRKGAAYRAVRQRVGEARLAVEGVARLQTELLLQNERALHDKVQSVRLCFDSFDEMGCFFFFFFFFFFWVGATWSD